MVRLPNQVAAILKNSNFHNFKQFSNITVTIRSPLPVYFGRNVMISLLEVTPGNSKGALVYITKDIHVSNCGW